MPIFRYIKWGFIFKAAEDLQLLSSFQFYMRCLVSSNFRCPFKDQNRDPKRIKCPFEEVNCSVLTSTTQAVCSSWQRFLKQVLDEDNGDMNLRAN